MSTDYKIGIVVGLVVLIAGIVYFLASGQDQTNDKPPIEVAPTEETTDVTVTPPPAAPSATEGATTPIEIPLETATPVTRPVAETIPPTPEPSEEVVRPTLATPPSAAPGFQIDPDADVALPETPAPSESAETAVTVGPAPPAAPGFQIDPDADAALREPDPEPVIRPIARPTTTEDLGSSGGTYVVKEGDNGFWIIAERVYGPGNGKYWTLIQRANPSADTNALREGQMLKIPPLPSTATTPTAGRASARAERADYGTVIESTGENRIYVVAEGEAGLWGVSEKVYGKGIYWEYIKRANPEARPTALRPGMKLTIPPLPDTPDTRGTTATTIAPSTATREPLAKRGEVFTENGRRYYLVAAGDKGYWGIAKKVYGEGKYSNLIDRANPGVRSDTLQPGDKLLVPPKPAETRTSPGVGRPRRTAPPIRSGEPDFGP